MLSGVERSGSQYGCNIDLGMGFLDSHFLDKYFITVLLGLDQIFTQPMFESLGHQLNHCSTIRAFIYLKLNNYNNHTNTY